MLPGLELLNCQNMVVPMEVMQHIVRVESSHNPYAIGVVGGHLVRQPKNLAEALSTVKMLETGGYNFSLGLAQVNRFNLSKYGLDSYEKAFEACPNLQAGSAILAECYQRLGGDWGKSFSCYYSGNSITGFRHGYVQKIFASMRKTYVAPAVVGAAIPVVSKPSRKVVGVTRHALYSTPLANRQQILASQPKFTPVTTASQISSTTVSITPELPISAPQSRMQRIIASYNQPQSSNAAVNVESLPPKQAEEIIQITPGNVSQSVAYTVAPMDVSGPAVAPVTPVPTTTAIPTAPSEQPGIKNSAFVF